MSDQATMGDITLLVQYVSKAGSVRRVVSGSSANEILGKCVDLFRLNGELSVEVYDTRFGEYVLVDECDYAKSLVDGSKVQLVAAESTPLGGERGLQRFNSTSTIQLLDIEGTSHLDPGSFILETADQSTR